MESTLCQPGVNPGSMWGEPVLPYRAVQVVARLVRGSEQLGVHVNKCHAALIAVRSDPLVAAARLVVESKT